MPETPAPEFRPMTLADIDATVYVRRAANERLDREQGRTPPAWQPGRSPHWEHLLSTDPEAAGVASSGGTVVGYSMGFTRGDIWFLAQLFVEPAVQSSGMGAELLRLSMDAGRKRGARVFSVVSSTSPVAQALYVRAGMTPAAIGYFVAGSAEALCKLEEPRGNRKRLVDCEGWQERLTALDREAWGAPRTEEHRLYMSGTWGREPDGTLGLNRDGNLAGYIYAANTGHLGPMAAYDEADQLQLLRMAGDWLASRGIEEATAYVLSSNPTVLRTLLDGGWRVRGWTFFMTSEPFGRFDRYMPGSGMLL